MNSIEELLQFIPQYGKEIERLRSIEPYRINLVDEFHINENAHTRILMKLLKYREDGCHVILNSFIRMVSETCDISMDEIIRTPILTINKEYIDGLIEFPREIAFIIENKIKGAVDQNKQIENYVNTVISHGVPSDKIFAIYLTHHGEKTIDDRSLTDNAKKLLGNHFLPLNYRDHILPWLKNAILPNLRTKERFLISAIEQYIDYLEGQFQQREYQKNNQKKMEHFISDKLGFEKQPTDKQYQTIKEYLNNVRQLQGTLERMLIEKRKSIFSSFTRITQEYWGDQWCTNDMTDRHYYQILNKQWNFLKYNIHLEWIPLTTTSILDDNQCLTLVFHDESGSKTLRNTIRQATAHLPYACDDNHVLFRRDCSVNAFYSLPYNEQRTMLESIYQDALAFVSAVDDALKNLPAVQIYNKYYALDKECTPFEELWFWKSNFPVLGKHLKINIDCTTEGIIELSYFHQDKNIQNEAETQFCQSLGMVFEKNAYHVRYVIVDNNLSAIFNTIDAIIDHKR